MLRFISHGTASDLPPVLIVHGLFGSARNWGAIAARMGERRLVMAVDVRNHGESPWFPTHTYADMAADLAKVLEPYGQADVLGHSMGGKASMMLALTRPHLVRRLLVADIAPVAYSHSQQGNIDAMRALTLAALTSRVEADRLMRETVPEAGVRAFLLQSLDLRATPPRWRLNLDVLEASMPYIVGWPEAATGLGFSGRALFLSGGRSAYVLPAHRPAIKALFPAARFAKIAEAGHWLHADKPREFEATAEVFLS